MNLSRHLFVAYVLILVVIFPLQSSGMSSPFVPPDTSVRTPNPRTALLLGMIPGAGQVYNRKWAKAVLVVAMDAYAISQFQQSRTLYNDYQQVYPDAANPYLERRNRHAWRMLLFYLLGILDAYVDAHLSTFPADTTYEQLPEPEQLDKGNQ